ncbi:PDZ domain-containing protein [Klebsiella pneumoniae]|uniref:PDZ domain-containing protein n=1 Tax=Klebsiella pneumoniae TaxID=573 RepID=UPI0038629552
MPGKLLRSVLIGLLVGGLLLALMPSLRQWQLAPTTQNDTADDSPASYNDAVLAIGNPYNLGQTITQGIISATGRIGLNPTGRQNFLQTDASINHGNSGGALVNSLGELMGINTLSFDKSNDGETPEGIGFAIPFQLATKIMDKLIRDGRVIRGYIGISGREIAPLHAQGGGIDQIQGIVVNDVAPDGPAAQAGIRANDVIISVNDKPAVSALETMDQVAEIRPGSEIPVVIMRDDKKITLHIAVQEYPATN